MPTKLIKTWTNVKVESDMPKTIKASFRSGELFRSPNSTSEVQKSQDSQRGTGFCQCKKMVIRFCPIKTHRATVSFWVAGKRTELDPTFPAAEVATYTERAPSGSV